MTSWGRDRKGARSQKGSLAVLKVLFDGESGRRYFVVKVLRFTTDASAVADRGRPPHFAGWISSIAVGCDRRLM
jgi:hypothetical protein